MFLQRIKPKHFLIPLAVLLAAFGISYALFTKTGSCINESTVLSGNSLIPGFLSGFFITVLPITLVLLLSITVYASPAALVALLFEGVQDGYYIFSLWSFYTACENPAPLHILLFALTRAFYSYCYLIAAVQTLSFRDATRNRFTQNKPQLTKQGVSFLSAFTATGGAMCLCGIFTHLILYYS